ncbi:MAG: alcohol dehydrogenase [Actinomycetota bacterium]|nr:alcohol dehydrogenase [Actinomycetota bacterium]
MEEVVEYLGLEDLVELAKRLGVGPVRDPGLLGAAAARPAARLGGEDIYPSLALKAAALLHGLVGAGAFVAGNARLAWLATTVFMDLNGRKLSVSDEAARSLIERASGDPVDLVAIASVLESSSS